MVKIKPLPPEANVMDMLGRWPSRESLTTSEIIEITGKDHSVVYRWMMRLAIMGYFNRRNDPRISTNGNRGGGTIVTWTITPKGRACALELQGETA